MAKAEGGAHGAGSAAQFEAEIRANARPMLTKEERAEAASQKAELEARYAAAKARDAAAAQTAKAEEYEAQAAKFKKGR